MELEMDNQHGNIEELLYKTAYAFGFLLGDGYLGYLPRKHAIQYTVSFTCRDGECLLRVRDELSKIFPEIKLLFETYKKGQYVLQSQRRDMWEFFTAPTEFKQIIPQVYFSAPKEVQREVIAGLMDADGCCEEFKQGNSWKYKIVFSNQKLEIIKGLSGLLRLVGCKVGELKANVEYTGKWQYRISPNIYDFANNCYFHCERKQARLERFKQLRCASETMHTPSLRG